MTPFLMVAVIAAAVTAVVTVGMLRLAKRLHLAPALRERDVHTTPTPR